MNSSKLAFLTVIGIALTLGGSEYAHAQFYGGIGYGHHHHHSGIYAGGFYPGAYGYYPSPYQTYSPGYASSYGYSSSYYGIGSPGYGTSYGLGAYNPVIVAPSPMYGTTTTIIRGGPTGGVIQYSNNGNGYTYGPASSYPTVIQQQPTLGLSRTFVPPSPPPMLIESRPQGSTFGPSNSSTLQPPTRAAGTIKLVCPKTAGGPLSYSLNGNIYTIQPGYSQSFRDDRAWTLEFKRGGEGSEVAQYALKAGTYNFAVGANGWELQQPGTTPIGDLPPAPLPDLSPTLSPAPTPLPPP